LIFPLHFNVPKKSLEQAGMNEERLGRDLGHASRREIASAFIRHGKINLELAVTPGTLSSSTCDTFPPADSQ
jgi:hypothetical protein